MKMRGNAGKVSQNWRARSDFFQEVRSRMRITLGGSWLERSFPGLDSRNPGLAGQPGDGNPIRQPGEIDRLSQAGLQYPGGGTVCPKAGRQTDLLEEVVLHGVEIFRRLRDEKDRHPLRPAFP